MRASRQIAPYDKHGRSNLGFTNKQSGVYLIYRNGELRYVGFSRSNLYKTCTRHFQRWNSKYQKVVTYHQQMGRHDFKVRIVLCSPERAAKLEKALIVRHQPRDNPDKLQGYQLNTYEVRALNDFRAAPAENYEDIIVPF